EEGAELIVMGAQGRGGPPLTPFGSTTQQVGRAASCPVLTVRAPWVGYVSTSCQSGNLTAGTLLTACSVGHRRGHVPRHLRLGPDRLAGPADVGLVHRIVRRLFHMPALDDI